MDHAEGGDVPLQDVLEQVPGLLVLPGLTQIAGVAVLRLQGERVVLTEDAATCVQDRYVEFGGRVVVADEEVVQGQVVARHERAGMLVPEHAEVPGVQVLVQLQGVPVTGPGPGRLHRAGCPR